MEPGRIWQRGASKGRKGSTNARMMQSSANQGGSNMDKVIATQQNKYSNSDNVQMNQNNFQKFNAQRIKILFKRDQYLLLFQIKINIKL